MASEADANDVLVGEVRPGSYYDSIVLMELQVSLAALPGVREAGAAMGTRSNLALLRDHGLLLDEAAAARDEDLVIAVRGETRDAAERALAAVDDLLVRRRGQIDAGYRPHTLGAAHEQLPDARWVLVSVPGSYAADLAREALALDLAVFLYSDNVSREDEVELKREATRRGLLVLGPDCGTALVGGVGFGFVNRVRAGSIGLVGPSGTGLQAVASLIHEGGGGVSHILGTGGRDLSPEIAGATTLRAVPLLGRDPATEVVVVVSKPPEPDVVRQVIAALHATGKPAVVYFQGLHAPHHPPIPTTDRVTVARNLDEAATLALRAAGAEPPRLHETGEREAGSERLGGHVRGLLSGGTLALEMLLYLRQRVAVSSNLALEGVAKIDDPGACRGHAVLDLGADELTVGRLHPMIDFDLRCRLLERQAADPDVALVLVDVVLGDGAHPDPGAALENSVRAASQSAEVVALVIGTDEDPQDIEDVCRLLSAAGARVFRRPESAFEYVLGCAGRGAGAIGEGDGEGALSPAFDESPVDLAEAGAGGREGAEEGLLEDPVKAINVGLESFYRSLVERGVEAVDLDWRPPAGGNRRLQQILERMKGQPRS